MEEAKRKRETLLNQKKEALVGRSESEERTAKLAKLEELEKKNKQLKSELQKFADNNPLLIKAMEEDVKTAKDAANRWTDNLFLLRSHMQGRGVDLSHFDKNYGIPEDLDYI